MIPHYEPFNWDVITYASIFNSRGTKDETRKIYYGEFCSTPPEIVCENNGYRIGTWHTNNINELLEFALELTGFTDKIFYLCLIGVFKYKKELDPVAEKRLETFGPIKNNDDVIEYLMMRKVIPWDILRRVTTNRNLMRNKKVEVTYDGECYNAGMISCDKLSTLVNICHRYNCRVNCSMVVKYFNSYPVNILMGHDIIFELKHHNVYKILQYLKDNDRYDLLSYIDSTAINMKYLPDFLEDASMKFREEFLNWRGQFFGEIQF